jgi:hypothetical protein
MEEFKIDPTIQYDVVELPSMGMQYASKKKSLRVAYLDATDENILSAQNLIQSNTVIDELLKRKILDRDFNVEELTDEDRQAVLIFLRSTAWGPEYKFFLIDPKTNEQFERIFDLSELSFKEFKLIPDTNGEFPFRMEKSNVNITFKFLTKAQEKELEEIEKTWNGIGVPPINTKRLAMMIKSVDGNRDPMNLYHFIEKLAIKDSQDFKKYVKENKPGIDLKREVKTPSGDTIQVEIGFGVEFFRPFYGL